MGDIVKLALRLFIFALVASVLLAITNEVTKGPIEAQKLASKMTALNTVLPGCEYEQIAYEGISEDSVLDEIFVGKNADGSVTVPEALRPYMGGVEVLRPIEGGVFAH